MPSILRGEEKLSLSPGIYMEKSMGDTRAGGRNRQGWLVHNPFLGLSDRTSPFFWTHVRSIEAWLVLGEAFRLIGEELSKGLRYANAEESSLCRLKLLDRMRTTAKISVAIRGSRVMSARLNVDPGIHLR